MVRSQLDSTPLIPEEFAAQYRRAGLWGSETIPEFLQRVCEKFTEHTAVVADSHAVMAETGATATGSIRWSYGELARQGRTAASRLITAGVEPGDRVLLQLPNVAEYLSYLLGIFWAGALPVFCLPTHREMEIAHFAQKTDAAAVVYSSQTLGIDIESVQQKATGILEQNGAIPPQCIDVSVPRQVEELAAPIRPPKNTDRLRDSEQIAFLQLSGGTTGISKLIPRTHADYLYSVRGSVDICRLDQQSTLLVVLPAAHNFTMSSAGILGAMQTGAKMVFAADPSPQASFKLIERESVKVVPLVPPLLQAWIASACRRRPKLESLEMVQVGGAKLLASVAEQVSPVLGAQLQQVFGMAEGLVNYTRAGDSDRIRFHTQGRPISEFDEILVVDDDGVRVPEGEPGHLLTRGPYTIRGYYREPEINRSSFTEEGFYRSGDIVRVLPGGYLEVTGRAKDQINRNGEKVAVDEIENFALAHEKVHDAVALGLPDDRVGERICLVVVPAPGADFGSNPRRSLHDYFAQAGLAEHKIPERVEIVTRFPVTGVGKISRREIRAALLAQFTGDAE